MTARPEVLQALGIIGYEVAFAMLGKLTEKGIVSTHEGIAIIESALSSVEAKHRETPSDALQASIELLGIHQAMFVQRGDG